MHTVKPWIGILLERLLWIYAQLRKATQENAERDLGFQESYQAEVDTLAKYDTGVEVQIDDELVWVLEPALVVAGMAGLLQRGRGVEHLEYDVHCESDRRADEDSADLPLHPRYLAAAASSETKVTS